MTGMPIDNLARRLRKARLDRNITQPQLAAMLGCSQEMLSRIEAGDREPGLGLLPKIQKWLASGKGAPTKAPKGPYRK
jgi:transcriptional regulator with XRE-family HTH domain